MSLLFKIDYSEDVNITREADPNEEYDRNSTVTSRTLIGAELVNNNSYNVGGDFTLEELIKNDNKIYVVYYGLNYSDSFGSDDNNICEFVEAFLTKEKADNLIKALNIMMLAANLTEYGIPKKNSNEYLNLDMYSREMHSLGFEKDFINVDQEKPFAILEYKSENGENKSLYVSWLNTCDLYELSVESFIVEVPNLVINHKKSRV